MARNRSRLSDSARASSGRSNALPGPADRVPHLCTADRPGDQVVHLPVEHIVFAGALIEERMFPIVPLFPPMIAADDIDVARWEMALADVPCLEPRLMLPSHGNLGGAGIASDVLGCTREGRALVQAAGRLDDRLEEGLRARYPAWERSRFLGAAVQHHSRALT